MECCRASVGHCEVLQPYSLVPAYKHTLHSDKRISHCVCCVCARMHSRICYAFLPHRQETTQICLFTGERCIGCSTVIQASAPRVYKARLQSCGEHCLPAMTPNTAQIAQQCRQHSGRQTFTYLYTYICIYVCMYVLTYLQGRYDGR